MLMPMPSARKTDGLEQIQMSTGATGDICADTQVKSVFSMDRNTNILIGGYIPLAKLRNHNNIFESETTFSGKTHLMPIQSKLFVKRLTDAFYGNIQ